jgi:formylglycine-generating enzyme required for sulfatase activity
MSGNLLEWTGTVSRGNPGFYNVLGGFWQSGVRSSCFDIRSSYFPQNRQNPVGFRCCKDAP